MGDYVNKRKNGTKQLLQTSLFNTQDSYMPRVKSRSNFDILSDTRYSEGLTSIISSLVGTESQKTHNKNMHSDKIKLRSFLTTLYFAGDVKRYAARLTY